MKRLFCLLLALLMLSACGSDDRETQAATESTPAVPTEPSGCYDPASTVEMFTEGAVRAYPLPIPDTYAVAAAGSDVLVFSGKSNTRLTRLTGENLFRIAEIQLDTMVSPENSHLMITEDRIIYFDKHTNELVWLDESFREFNRLVLPGDLTGSPVLSADRTKVYYCTANAIRVLDVETGLSRILKEATYPKQHAQGLLMEDRVLHCVISDADTEFCSLFIDTQTGELLAETRQMLDISYSNSMFYAWAKEDSAGSLICGREGEPVRELDAAVVSEGVVTLLPESGAAAAMLQKEEQRWLEYYDLVTGRKTSAVMLPERVNPWYCTGDGEGKYLYFLSHGEAESQILYRWDMAVTPTGEDTVYTNHWYTAENPDEEGLTYCQARADALGQKYGMEIRIWQRALENQPWDYDFTGEYRVETIQSGLDQLEGMLSHFPADFFTKAMEGMEDGGLHLCLVRSLTGSAEAGSLENAQGVQFWDGNDAYAALALREGFEKAFYHEIFHVLETRALSRSIAYYRWDELNPKGFDYDYDYAANAQRDGSAYIDDDTTRCFIDTYSMSFPKEDRARIFEYACTEGNEDFFISHTMQRKLRALCEGIREAYDLEKNTESFLWEQYLESPLAYEG